MRSRSPTFWSGLAFAGFAALGALGWKTHHLANDASTLAFVLMFGGLALLMVVWEFGRHFQGAGTRWQILKLGEQTRTVYLLRGSGLQVGLVALFFLIVGVGAGVFSRFEPAAADRQQMGLGAVAALFTAVGYAITNGFRARGIALTPDGLLWLKERTPLLVPWDCIESVGQIRVPKDVGYGLKYHEPSLGIRLKFDAMEQLRELRRAPAPCAYADGARNTSHSGAQPIGKRLRFDL